MQVELGVADFRDLASVEGLFDVVITCDNALPHLESDAEIVRAFASMRAKLRDGGVLLASVRDYDRSDRPPLAQPQVVEGPPRRVLVRLHEWDSPDSPLYTVRFLVLTEADEGWTVREHATRYRAVGRAALVAAAEEAGLADVTWHDGEHVDFPQPVLTARR